MDILPTISEAENAVLNKMSPDDRGELSVAVRDNLRLILFGMIEAAKGMYIEKIVKDKYERETVEPVFRKEPNMDVAQYLINQLMGKPKETSVDLHLKQNIIVQNEITVKKMV